MSRTHTVVELEISAAAYDEIRGKLAAAGYQHAFDDEGMIDMTGIGVTRGPDMHPKPSRIRMEMRAVTIAEDGTTTTRFRRNFGRQA